MRFMFVLICQIHSSQQSDMFIKRDSFLDPWLEESTAITSYLDNLRRLGC